MPATRAHPGPTVPRQPGVAPKHSRAALRRELVRLSHLARNSPRAAQRNVFARCDVWLDQVLRQRR